MGMLTRLLWCVLGCLWWCQATLAHDMPHSTVSIVVKDDRWGLHLVLPEDRLEVAFVQAGLRQAAETQPITASALRTYVQDRLGVTSIRGEPWRIDLLRVIAPISPSNEWQIDIDARPPMAHVPDQAQLRYTVIVREIATHSAMVYLKQDWSRGLTPQAPVLLGALRATTQTMWISRQQGQVVTAYWAMLTLGVHHILEGADHLLFLLMLLMMAPLEWRERRWQPVVQAKTAWKTAGLLVSAFTVGHLTSLLAVSVGWWPAGGTWVESLIALSVVVTAVHVMYPVFPRQELALTVLFGLVHGLGFAEVLRDFSLPMGQLVAATLSFNVGVELVQLLIVLLVLPIFLRVRQQTWSLCLRAVLAVPTLVVSLLWMWQRLP
jgi:hypothetical protein